MRKHDFCRQGDKGGWAAMEETHVSNKNERTNEWTKRERKKERNKQTNQPINKTKGDVQPNKSTV